MEMIVGGLAEQQCKKKFETPRADLQAAAVCRRLKSRVSQFLEILKQCVHASCPPAAAEEQLNESQWVLISGQTSSSLYF